MRKATLDTEKRPKDKNFSVSGIQKTFSSQYVPVEGVVPLVECHLQTPTWLKCISTFMKYIGKDNVMINFCFGKNYIYIWESLNCQYTSERIRCFTTINCNNLQHYTYAYDQPLLQVSIKYKNFQTTFDGYNKQNLCTVLTVVSKNEQHTMTLETVKQIGYDQSFVELPIPLGDIDPQAFQRDMYLNYFDTDECQTDFRDILLKQQKIKDNIAALNKCKNSSQQKKMIEQLTQNSAFEMVLFDEVLEQLGLVDIQPDTQILSQSLKNQTKMAFIIQHPQHMENCMFQYNRNTKIQRFVMQSNLIKNYITEVNKDSQLLHIIDDEQGLRFELREIPGCGAAKLFKCLKNKMKGHKIYKKTEKTEYVIGSSVLKQIISACDDDFLYFVLLEDGNVIVKIKPKLLTMKFNISLQQ